jgi:hypothetical protein
MQRNWDNLGYSGIVMLVYVKRDEQIQKMNFLVVVRKSNIKHQYQKATASKK